MVIRIQRGEENLLLGGGRQRRLSVSTEEKPIRLESAALSCGKKKKKR